VGLNASIQPGGSTAVRSTGSAILASTASYQYLGDGRHNVAAYASFIREDQTRGDLFANAGADNLTGRSVRVPLQRLVLLPAYLRATIGRFSTRGTPDATLYGPSGSPDTSGTVLQIDWTPWGKEDSWARPFANVRLGLQYTTYDKFDGASGNYDGNGRNASDNNTLFLFLWAAI